MFSDSFKIKLTSRDLDFFINFNFLSICLKYSKNDLFKINSSTENLIKFEKETRNFDFFVNYNFLSIRLKCLRNDWFIVYPTK